ncbi:MAG: hypothetical protein ACRAUW_12480 [Aeromonas sp.]|uniref:hypothetical protein n=1 Tax=Aeromonas sp. TaxID=647 RepID=UPI003D6B965A
MFSVLKNLFGRTLYVQIWENRIRVVDLKSQRAFDEKPLLCIDMKKGHRAKVLAFGNAAVGNTNTGTAINPFSHPRSLISDPYVAGKLLKLVVKQLCGSRLFSPVAAIIIQPMEKMEGELTATESKGLRDIALEVGCENCFIYTRKTVLDPSIRSLNDFIKRGEANPLT